MNSRWQANKIGLINFWYYDEQEFPFVKGRMLLRGSNGSGKSVTMQSVVPLLLDGNMNPERLDPFGSRDRKMSSYLLEENDGREERTGYLYLEWKRQESDTYITIGMGIRARRGKPLDKWYFAIHDGRRIGRDFFLYKETGEKVTLSKKELEYRIQGGGKVFERQADYMEYVNRQIFGFEKVEEYKEMIDLLIQLRTPKLSKDFKPSVINDILSDSQQSLSDEDLRPMSEAIENMDTMNMNLKSRREAKQAAEKINRVLNRYNQLVLFEKAENYETNRKQLEALEKEERRCKKEKEDGGNQILKLDEELVQINAKKDAMEKERESLSKSDALSLKQQETDLKERLENNEKRLEEKKKQLEDKEEKYREIENKKKEEQNKKEEKSQELFSILEQMQSDAEDMAFEEHTIFEEELREQFEEDFSFSMHEEQLKDTQEKIARGVELLKEIDMKYRQADSEIHKKEEKKIELDALESQGSQLERVFVQVQNEFRQKIYSWNSKNQQIHLSKENLKKISDFAENYSADSDFAAVRQIAADCWIARKGEIHEQMHQVENVRRELEESYKEQENELKEWQKQKEPEPKRSKEVCENRKRLKEMKIPYQEFYKTVEFGDKLDKEKRNHLEETLWRMGILDALIVDEEYRSQIFSMKENTCDSYLFVQKSQVQKSLLDILELDDSIEDMFLNQRVVKLLQSIAYEEEASSAIRADGSYRMGVLEGTITRTYEAGFIGTQAREKNRLAKMQACEQLMKELEEQINEMRKQEQQFVAMEQESNREYEALPQDTDIREAYRMLKDNERKANDIREAIRNYEEVISKMKEELQVLKTEAVKIAEKLGLECRLNLFTTADNAAREYGQLFYRVREGHSGYLQFGLRLYDFDEQMEDLEFDLDQIRYEQGNIERTLRKEQAEYESVCSQLKLTDYEQIKERIDACMQWIQEYPKILEQCIKLKSDLGAKLESLQSQIEQNQEKVQEYSKGTDILHQFYQNEFELSYVEIPEEVSKTPAGVWDFLKSTCRDWSKESIVEDLNKVYFENRGFLNEHQPTQVNLFAEEPAAKRLDISAKYQGVKITFGKLLVHLEEEIQELSQLIKDGDRELFEDILANTISRKIRAKINSATTWVDKMNDLMGAMNTSSGLKLSLRWRSKTAENEDQLDTKELVELLKKDYRTMKEEEAQRLSLHFRSKVEEARRSAKDSGGQISFYQVMKDTLDYRKWFEFQLYFQKSGEKQKELTNSVFGTFSGGEKAMSMYVPLFSAVVAKYEGGDADAPRLISLDEAFAGVDNKNIRDMFRLMTEFKFDFVINSQVLWGDCDTLDALAIYQLIRPQNAKFVTVMPYLWNGKAKELLENEGDMEQRAGELA